MFMDVSVLEDETSTVSETSGTTYPAKRRHVPEQGGTQNRMSKLGTCEALYSFFHTAVGSFSEIN
jgi:hypothetical protein